MRRTLSVLTAVASMTLGLTLAAPSAQAEEEALCSGTPAYPLGWVCIVHFHPEDAFPEIETGDEFPIPRLCAASVCFGPTVIEAPGVHPHDHEIIVVYWNDTCFYIFADGRVDQQPATLDRTVHPPMPDCP